MVKISAYLRGHLNKVETCAHLKSREVAPLVYDLNVSPKKHLLET